jgi:RNA polymerase sigma-70 factor, ECF subfamily
MRLVELFKKKHAKNHEVAVWVKTYSSEFYRYAYVRVHNHEEAEDIVQRCFVKAYQAFDSFTPGSNEKAWLYTILINLIRDHLSKLSNRSINLSLQDSQLLETLVDLKSNPEAQLSRKMDLVELEEALSKLPELFAVPLLLHEVSDMKYEDIAKMLSIPIGTVMSRLHRARKALYEMLPGDSQNTRGGTIPQVTKNKNQEGGEKDGLR